MLQKSTLSPERNAPTPQNIFSNINALWTHANNRNDWAKLAANAIDQHAIPAEQLRTAGLHFVTSKWEAGDLTTAAAIIEQAKLGFEHLADAAFAACDRFLQKGAIELAQSILEQAGYEAEIAKQILQTQLSVLQIEQAHAIPAGLAD